MVGLYIIELKYTLCVFLSDDSLCFIPGNTNFAPQFAAALLIIFHSTIDKSISRGVLEKAILKHFAKFKKKKRFSGVSVHQYFCIEYVKTSDKRRKTKVKIKVKTEGDI